MYVHGGVLGGQSEQLIEDHVIHNDPTSLPASWKGRDSESGIMEYLVAIGTGPG